MRSLFVTIGIALFALCLQGCSECVFCSSSSQLDSEDEAANASRELSKAGVVHHRDGLTIHFQPWDFNAYASAVAIKPGWMGRATPTEEDRERLIAILDARKLEYRVVDGGNMTYHEPVEDQVAFSISDEYAGRKPSTGMAYLRDEQARSKLGDLQVLLNGYSAEIDIEETEQGLEVSWFIADKESASEAFDHTMDLLGYPRPPRD